MPKPYAQLRAQMSKDAQQRAEEKARAMLAALPPPVQGAPGQAQAIDEAALDDA